MIILPFEKNVPIIFYQNKAYPLGIIESNITNKEILQQWYAQEYINCRFSAYKPNKFDIGTEDFYYYDDDIIRRQYIRLYKSSFAIHNIVYSQLILEYLKRGFYIRGNYNEKYISTSNFYNKEDHMHDYLLIGFDEDRMCFKAIGYQSNLKYDYFNINFKDFELSLENSTDYYVEFNILEFNKEKKFTFNLSKIIKHLKYYLYSQNDTMREGVAYGLSAIEKLREYYIFQYNNGDSLDFRYSRAIMEHKYLMLQRLAYLYKCGYISCANIAKDYEYISNRSKILHNLCLKYNLCAKSTYFEEINSILKEIIAFDALMLTDIIKILEEM